MKPGTIGFAAAVTKAVASDCDKWLLFMPQRPGKPGRIGSRRPAFSPPMDSALRESTHDQLDAAHMRLCLDDNDAIRRLFLEGF